MKELSIFIDESGDFGEYDFHSPFYIITMVFHDQTNPIDSEISKLNQELSYLNLHDLCIHTGPIIVEVSKILSSVFNAMLPSVEFRKVMPENYKLFQVADLLCSLFLVKLKAENNLFSNSEKQFFGSLRDLNKNYLKPLLRKEWV